MAAACHGFCLAVDWQQSRAAPGDAPKNDSGLHGFVQKTSQFLAKTLARTIQAGFHPAFRAAGDGADLAVGKPFEVVEQNRGLQEGRSIVCDLN